MGRWRRDSRIAGAEAQERIELAVAAVAESAQRLAVRVERLERRVEDVEDAACSGLAPDRIDVLAARVEGLDLMAATHAEVMEVRMHSARVMAELDRLAVEVRGQANGAGPPPPDPGRAGARQHASPKQARDRLRPSPADSPPTRRPRAG